MYIKSLSVVLSNYTLQSEMFDRFAIFNSVVKRKLNNGLKRQKNLTLNHYYYVNRNDNLFQGFLSLSNLQTCSQGLSSSHAKSLGERLSHLPLHFLQVAEKDSSQRLWDVLRKAVQSGSYKGDYLPTDSAMYWESIFTPGASSTEGYKFVSAASNPVKSPEFQFSGPGPPNESREESGEEQGASWKGRQERPFNFPPNLTEESEFESSANELESDERRREPSQSPPIEPVQLSPAPEEYYRIVPITPFTPYKDRREATEPSFSWKLPQTFTSRDRDVVQTLSQAYKEPRVVPFSRPQHETGGGEGAPPAKQRLFDPSAVKRGRETKENRPSQPKTSRQKKTERKSRKVVAFKHQRKMSPRKEPDGEPAEKMASSTRGKAKHSTPKFRVKSSLKSHKMASRRKYSGSAEVLSKERPTSEMSEEEPLVDDSSRLSADVHTRLHFPSISTVEYLTPPVTPLKDFYSITRSQSDPSVEVEHFRNLRELSSETRRTRSMSEFRGDETTDEEKL